MDLSGPGIDIKLKERKKEDPRSVGACERVLERRKVNM
jgi:hypothetical protein